MTVRAGDGTRDRDGSDHREETADREEPGGPLFWSAFVVGWAAIAFGLWTVLDRAGAIHPVTFGAWFVGLTLLHDLVVAPLVSAVALVAGPRLPPRIRGGVTVAAIVSASLVLVSLPPLLGDPAGNDTILVRSYGPGLAVAVLATWAITALWLVVRTLRGRAR